MPQLDITILFSQIFWLLFFFILFYTLLVYTFLPKFVTSLKLRKDASESNLVQVNQALSNLSSGSELTKIKLLKNLEQLQKNFDLIMSIYKNNLIFEKGITDMKFSTMTFNVLIFSDVTILKNIKLTVKGFKSKI